MKRFRGFLGLLAAPIGLLALFAVAQIPIAEGQALNTYLMANPATPGTITTTLRALGLGTAAQGCRFFSQTSGRFEIAIGGAASNTVANDGWQFQVIVGPASAAPANGAALPATWTAYGGALGATNMGTSVVPFQANAIVSGLTPGVLYGMDLLTTIVTGGNVIAQNLTCMAMEG